MYCVRCKRQTDTTNEQFTTSKNNRSMKRGKCAVLWGHQNTIC